MQNTCIYERWAEYLVLSFTATDGKRTRPSITQYSWDKSQPIVIMLSAFPINIWVQWFCIENWGRNKVKCNFLGFSHSPVPPPHPQEGFDDSAVLSFWSFALHPFTPLSPFLLHVIFLAFPYFPQFLLTSQGPKILAWQGQHWKISGQD